MDVKRNLSFSRLCLPKKVPFLSNWQMAQFFIPDFFKGPWRYGQTNGSADVSDTLPNHQNERNGWISSFEWWPTMCQCLLLVRAQETSRTGPHGGGEDWIGKGKMGQVLFATKALHHHSLILLKGVYLKVCYKSLLLTSLAKPAAFLSQFTQDACTLKTRKFVFKKLNFGNFRFSCHKTKIDFFLRNFGPHAKE